MLVPPLPLTATLGLYASAAFLYVGAGAYVLFVVSTALLFGRVSDQPRLARGVNFLLVPPALLVAVLGIGLATLNAFATSATVIRTPWALAMLGGGLGIASALLAAEGIVLRRRLDARRSVGLGLGTRVLGLSLTAVPLLVLGGVFVHVAIIS